LRLDVSSVGLLANVLGPEVASGGELTLDLAGVTFVDSTGFSS
jgi:anti-anti-sigma regulatory factor